MTAWVQIAARILALKLLFMSTDERHFQAKVWQVSTYFFATGQISTRGCPSWLRLSPPSTELDLAPHWLGWALCLERGVSVGDPGHATFLLAGRPGVGGGCWNLGDEDGVTPGPSPPKELEEVGGPRGGAGAWFPAAIRFSWNNQEVSPVSAVRSS